MNATDVKGDLRLLVLEGDGIGPEITAATLAVLRAADAKFGLRLAFEAAAVGWTRAPRRGHHIPAIRAGEGQGRAWRAAGAGVAQRISAGRAKAASIRPANCASGSTSTPILGRRARARAFRRVAARRSIS